MREDTIRILVTGGTFDKSYDQISGQLTFTTSHVQEILVQAKCTAPTEIELVMLKDSLFFEPGDRERILKTCRNCSERRVLITHGTDSMVETARLIGSEDLKKTVVLTGAMVPVTVSHSDAQFNLGFALAAAATLARGVYIAMNARIFSWDQVNKNKEKGIFEPGPPEEQT